MASYFFKMFMDHGKTPEDPEENNNLKEVNNNSSKTGNDDNVTISKIDTEPVGKNLTRQKKITKESLKSLDRENGKSGVDVCNPNNIKRTADEDSPNIFEKRKHSEAELKKQINTITMELIKLEKQSEKHDLKLKEIKQKFYLLQVVINQAKEAHEQVDAFVTKKLPK
ncbi:unnamed protein product [Ceutorhynchus assimilis]|uniref:Uncharacterized protein n=1 Tax=Ceutorhynchus assimilis TaxID=467358 RepID=A0A9N9MMM2_9CUCU|nr:unnamed protein product [Ceutorhynchus assimilis]